jgi:hypothetical protein
MNPTFTERSALRQVTASPLDAELARVRALPWPARHLARRHNLPASTARVVAEATGFSMRGGL